MIDYSNIASKIEDMIKDKIKAEGLVKTGALLNSIRVTPSGNGTFRVEGEDYFKYLDDEYGISSSVFNSSELISFMEADLAKQMEEELYKKVQKTKNKK